MKLKHELETPINTLKTIFSILAEDNLLSERMLKNIRLSFDRVKELISQIPHHEEETNNLRVQSFSILCDDIELTKNFYMNLFSLVCHSEHFDSDASLRFVKLSSSDDTNLEIILIKSSTPITMSFQYFLIKVSKELFQKIKVLKEENIDEFNFKTNDYYEFIFNKKLDTEIINERIIFVDPNNYLIDVMV